ncbi:hypothetical protein GCM10010411_53760 [Actinomadura fulvescens]|uniref:non-specific serine/threonine protein kinase n=1 Tax=Actinomadura fulvescens TaxID=46160 RepID=A0ABN3Q4R7_9ACTN
MLESTLGHGASGEVWRGRSHEGEEFAFKILHDSLSRDPETVRRFLQEGDLLTRITHPNVVRVHGLVAEEDTLAIVMDLVQGRDMRMALDEGGALPPGSACTLGAEVAQGLAAIHDAGVVHRDVKPENVLLDERTSPPSVRLVDFGIARIAEQTGSKATKMVGTPAYIAPEVADGKPATAASDLYALGIMLYELCCGVTPFADDSVYQTLQKHARHLPGRPDGIPDPLWELIASLLDKDPAKRPSSATAVAMRLSALAVDLAPAQAAPRLTAPPPSIDLVHRQMTESTPHGASTSPVGPPAKSGKARRGRRVIGIVAGVLLLAVVIAGGAYAALGSKDDRTPPQRPTTQGPEAGEPTPTAAPSSARPSYPPDKLPHLLGLKEQEARAMLSPKIQVQVIRQQPNDGTPDGVVLAQDPQPGSDIPSSLQLTVSSAQAVQYLADMTPTSGETLTTGTETAGYRLSGHPQLHALGAAGNPCNAAGIAEYDLGRHFVSLAGLAGLDDASEYAKTEVTLEVYGDEVKLKTLTLTLGKPKQLQVDVRGVLRLKLRWEFTKGDASGCSGGTLVLGNAHLVAASGFVPGATPTPS